MAERPARPCVVGIGEALYDVFDSGPRLGGAPLNVAVHANRLLSPHGGRGVAVSRVADDNLGQQLLTDAQQLGLDPTLLQRDAPVPTGRVDVEQFDDGSHAFHIADPSAWDHLTLTPDLTDLAKQCDAVAFGSLAQRHATSRATIRAFLDAASDAIKLFDVNLRASDGNAFYDTEVLTAGCHAADIVKLNDEELETVCDLTGTADADALLKQFGLRAVILTRGKDGTAALTRDGWDQGELVSYDRQPDADTVGAGDACSAGLLAALVRQPAGRFDIQPALDLANHLGAFVAGRVGATPPLPGSIIQRLP